MADAVREFVVKGVIAPPSVFGAAGNRGSERITTDTAPEIIGPVDWRIRTYIRSDAVETMGDYVGQDGIRAGVEDNELTWMAIGSVD